MIPLAIRNSFDIRIQSLIDICKDDTKSVLSPMDRDANVPVQGKSPLVQVKKPYSNLEIVTHVPTLSKISNWSPFIFYASFESKIRLNEIHVLINQPRIYRDSAGHFILKILVLLAQTMLE